MKEKSRPHEKGARSGRWYLPGVLYEGILDRLLVGIRKKVRECVIEAGLFPLIDICCGPGMQLGRLREASRGPRPPGFDRLMVGLDINIRLTQYAAARRPEIPFVCGDATALPFRSGSFKGALLSFALHEQEPGLRRRILAAAEKALAPGGRLVLVDFERPWDPASRRAYAYTSVIEWLAGARHFLRNRDFFRRGGLRTLIAESGFQEIQRYDIAAGTCAIVIAAPRPEVT